MNYLTADVEPLVAFYTDVLGLAVTDRIGDGAVWLHCDRDHHVLAFLDKGYEHLHHLAFELVDWGELRVALDHLAQHGRNVVWGPGRHSMAQNLFAYWRMVEEEHFIELFCDLEQLEADHEPRRFPDDPHASNAWGTSRRARTSASTRTPCAASSSSARRCAAQRARAGPRRRRARIRGCRAGRSRGRRRRRPRSARRGRRAPS